MRKTLLSTLVVALLLGAAATPAVAQSEMKPIVVLSLAGYDRLISDIDFLGRVSESPDLAKNLENTIDFFTQNQGLAGLDKTRPLGVAVNTDGLNFQILGFLPVTDVKKLLDALAGHIGEADMVDGLYKIQPTGSPASFFVKDEGGFAFVSQAPEGLANLPKEPLKSLGALNKEYDLALRVNVQNVPEAFRMIAIDQMKRGMEKGLQQQPGESDASFEQRSKMTHEHIDSTARMVEELDEMTFGFSIDEPGRRVYFDMALSAVEGTETAKHLAVEPAPPSKYAGFLLPDAVATLHVNSKHDETSTKQSLAMLGSLRTEVMSQIDDDKSIGSAKVRDTYKEVVGELLDVVQDTIKQGTFNGGAAVVGSGPFTLVAGGGVSDATKLDAAVLKMAELAKSERSLPADAVKLNAATHKGVTFHTLTVDVPEDDDHAEEVEKLLGDKVVVTLGIGKQSVFLGVGSEGIDTIKKVLDKSEGVTSAPTKPMELTIKLAPLLKVASEMPDANPMLNSLASSLKESGKDKVQLTASPVKNGMLYRLEAEEGILRVIGSAAKLAGAQAGVGAF